MKYRAISLFSGAGGMDVGFKNAGYNIIAANEFDKYACDTYRKNHPSCKMIEGDILENISAVSAHKNIDIVFGGPPCQGFSVAGKMDITDPRSRLVFSFCDVIDRIRPSAFVMENVKSLATLEKFHDIRTELFYRLNSSGYIVSMVVLNAKNFGVPQSRERVFFIGTIPELQAVSLDDFQRYQEESRTLREAIAHLGRAGSSRNPNVTKAKITLAENPVIRKSPYAGMLFNGQGRPLNPDAWSSTLPASMGGNRTPIIDEDHLYDNKPSWVEAYHRSITKEGKRPEYGEAPPRLRRLTIDEAAILQTFPSDYKFAGPQSRVFSQIGNAVPCKLAETVAKVVHSTLDGTRPTLRDNKQLQLTLK